jgi:hypothetical protein
MRLVDNGYTGPRATTLGCPSPDVLLALGGDALPDEVRTRAEAHVARCAACQALLADVAALEIEVPASLDRRVLGAASGGSSWKGMLLPMAAVLVAAAALGVWYLNSHRVAPMTATAPPPAAPVAPAAGQWHVAKPALLLPLATAIVVRGEAEEAANALGAALAPYRTDDYVEA